MNNYPDLELKVPKAEVTKAEQIFNILDGCTPKEKKKALHDAKIMVHEMFEKKVKEAQETLNSINKAWDEFKIEP